MHRSVLKTLKRPARRVVVARDNGLRRGIHLRRLLYEVLEDRRLLSIGPYPGSLEAKGFPGGLIAKSQPTIETVTSYFPATEDAWIRIQRDGTGFPDPTSQGNSPRLLVYLSEPDEDGDTEDYVSFLRFDLSSLPAGGFTVQEAKLHIYKNEGPDTCAEIEMQKIRGAWDEATVCPQDHPNWKDDYRGGPGSNQWLANGRGPGWEVHDLPNKDWVTDGVYFQDYGLCLRPLDYWRQQDPNRFYMNGPYYFVSSEGEEGKRPYLEVVYDTVDVTPPQIDGLSPADNAVDVAVGANLVIDFSENVHKGTGNIVIKKSSDDSVVETIDVNSGQVTISNDLATIDPSSNFVGQTGYYVQIASGAFEDLSGNVYPGISDKTTWDFTTFLPVVTNTQDSGTGSLRQVILDANANSGLDTITFNIAGGGQQTIQLLSALPVITDPVIIDGTTQPGFTDKPIIELDGSGAGIGQGLQIDAGNSTVRGLVINRFPGNGILLRANGNNVV